MFSPLHRRFLLIVVPVAVASSGCFQPETDHQLVGDWVGAQDPSFKLTLDSNGTGEAVSKLDRMKFDWKTRSSVLTIDAMEGNANKEASTGYTIERDGTLTINQEVFGCRSWKKSK